MLNLTPVVKYNTTDHPNWMTHETHSACFWALRGQQSLMVDIRYIRKYLKILSVKLCAFIENKFLNILNKGTHVCVPHKCVDLCVCLLEERLRPGARPKKICTLSLPFAEIIHNICVRRASGVASYDLCVQWIGSSACRACCKMFLGGGWWGHHSLCSWL